PKDVTFALASTPIRIRIADTPLKVTIPAAAPAAVKQGEKVNVPIAIERLYGFDDAIEVTIEPAQGSNGVSGEKFTLEKGKGNGDLVVVISGDATVGMQSAVIRVKAKWNNLSLESKHTIQLTVDKKEEKK
ncbi:MAG: hypothetical protein ACRED3_18450, partial [Bradyrhizobium sp.]